MRRSLPVVVLLASLGSFGGTGCAATTTDPPADAEEGGSEDALTSGAKRIATKLQDPDHLSVLDERVYFATNQGIHVPAPARSQHDIWVADAAGGARRLYTALYGTTMGVVASKHGIYDRNVDTFSVVRYPLDGSKAEGDVVIRRIVGDSPTTNPQMGIACIAADDESLVAALPPALGYDKTTLRVFPGGSAERTNDVGYISGDVTALAVSGSFVYAGTKDGKFWAKRAWGDFESVADAGGAINDIVITTQWTYLSSDKGVWRVDGGDRYESHQLTNESAGKLAVVNDEVFYVNPGKGIHAVSIDGRNARVVVKTKAPSSVAVAGHALFVTDAALGTCKAEDGILPCELAGSLIRAPH